MLLASIAILVGLLGLFWGADNFVDGAADTASALGVSPLIVGLTIVAFGTSAPEMLVALFAALDGARDMAIGNVVGSNIANIGLVVGGTAMIAPLAVHADTVRRDYPHLFLVTVLAIALMLDGALEVTDGLILLAGLVLSLIWMLWLGMKEATNRVTILAPSGLESALGHQESISKAHALGKLLLGLVVLVICSRLLVHGAVQIAQLLGVSQLIIGLSIVAVGTSLPELAASVAGVLKNQHDITIGNIVGSNLFNLLAVLCIPGLMAPGLIEPAVLSRDLPVMAGLTLLLWVVIRKQENLSLQIHRWGGLILMVCFVAYMGWLIIAAKNLPNPI
jgi:cation:H+ antiporter